MLRVIWTAHHWFHLPHLDIAFVKMVSRLVFPIAVILPLLVLLFVSICHPVSVMDTTDLSVLHLLQVVQTIFN